MSAVSPRTILGPAALCPLLTTGYIFRSTRPNIDEHVSPVLDQDAIFTDILGGSSR